MWDDDEITFFGNAKTSSMDAVLNTKISDLTDTGRKAKRINFKEGTRVAVNTNNGVVIPTQVPMSGTKGTVVAVRTASGEVTSMGGEVFVKFDGRDAKIDRIPAEFLQVVSMRVASIDDHFVILSGPSLMAHSMFADDETTLVHKATKDLWSVKLGEDGSYEIERMFDDNGNPIKI